MLETENLGVPVQGTLKTTAQVDKMIKNVRLLYLLEYKNRKDMVQLHKTC